MNKLKRKYIVVAVDFAKNKNEHRKKLPIIGAAYDANILNQLKTSKQAIFSFPSVFMMNTSADEILYFTSAGGRLSAMVKDIEKNMEGKEFMAKGIETEKDEPVKQTMQTWTNDKGKKIEAIALKTNDTTVTFKLKSGKTVEYPIKQLSQASRDKLKEMFSETKTE